MDRELQKYNYSEYYSKIRGQMNDKVALLTKDNCEIVGEPVSILEAPTALLIKDNEYEEPLYLREGIEIVFTQDYIRLLPEIGLEAEFLVKNELETPKEKPVRYIIRSGKLSKVYSKEHINLVNSIEIYSSENTPSFLWKREQVKQTFPKLKLDPAGYYVNKVNMQMCPLFDVKTLSVTNEFVIYSELDYYRNHSFLVGLEAPFHLLPKAWKINVHQDHMETVALYRGNPIVRLLSSAFEGSPLSKKLNRDEIEKDDIVCTLWDIETIRDILNMNNRKITLLVPRGITEEGLAVFSFDQDKWFREKFHVFWAMNRLKGYQSNDDF